MEETSQDGKTNDNDELIESVTRDADGSTNNIHIEDNCKDPMGQSIMNKSLYRITQMQMQAHTKLMKHEFSKFQLLPHEL